MSAGEGAARRGQVKAGGVGVPGARGAVRGRGGVSGLDGSGAGRAEGEPDAPAHRTPGHRAGPAARAGGGRKAASAPQGAGAEVGRGRRRRRRRFRWSAAVVHWVGALSAPVQWAARPSPPRPPRRSLSPPHPQGRSGPWWGPSALPLLVPSTLLGLGARREDGVEDRGRGRDPQFRSGGWRGSPQADGCLVLDPKGTGTQARVFPSGSEPSHSEPPTGRNLRPTHLPAPHPCPARPRPPVTSPFLPPLPS